MGDELQFARMDKWQILYYFFEFDKLIIKNKIAQPLPIERFCQINNLFLLVNFVFPKGCPFDAQFNRVKGVVFHACFLLSFVVVQDFHCHF